MTQTVGESSGASQPSRTGSSPPTSRVISIMELLADPARQSLTLAQIVRQTGLSRATAHAIVGELLENGWLLRDPASNTYGIGPGFVALARSVDSADHLSRWAGTAARALSERLSIPCFVARRTAPDSITVAEHAVPDHLTDGGDTSPWFRHGQRIRLRPPICREFIAWESSESRADWIARAPEATRSRLRRVLDVIADRGYSIERMTDDHVAMVDALSSLDTMSDGLRAKVGDLLTELSVIDYLPEELTGDVAAVTVGAPIRDASRSVVASLVACPNTTMSASELMSVAESTRAAADAISDQLTR
ncbi:helix-turn-helix domain-containing protein [Gordonia sp. SID5947]|uniref:helix-turn-helix domain-containing protein n=1 Tax=Gordonia sp. SID5947 TaxID=2690315 RepID=UPI00136860D4|nr:helix-turn-helix domain-containing protein [Gordonia sp. SID5947]